MVRKLTVAWVCGHVLSLVWDCISYDFLGFWLSVLCPVWATTAANAHESSYACYYDRKRQTYLGDVYSVKWMEDSDKVC